MRYARGLQLSMMNDNDDDDNDNDNDDNNVVALMLYVC
jgi:hypothetical protein